MYYKKYHKKKREPVLTDEEREQLRQQIEDVKKRIYTDNIKIKEKPRMAGNKIIKT